MEADLFKPKQFFVITYIVTYVSWLISAYLSYQPWGKSLFFVFMLPGLVAPFTVALAMIRKSGSKVLWETFKDRLTHLRLINPVVFFPSLLITPAAILIAAGISIALGGNSAQLQFAEGFSFTIGMVPTLIVLILAATFEELGWRSYAMDSLHSRYEYFTASLIFGLLWSGWHIPMFFINGTYQNEIVLQNVWYGVNFLVSIIPLAFIISWICKTNRGSITAAVILHFCINLAQESLQITQTTKCIETGILVVFAAVIILLNKSLFFDKQKGQ
jgi:uncharacterized protein